ncbi:winged helix-turn-helix transcriptional regulator [Pseudomaricurvus alkylphenolicus]|jgi:Lrp/AsnC family leucine-responsive transcriptional regulator|uniref:winged helix-turn-helix transcriptional regulator n=1 Tax=Pseudomaricurvus alkylphenolicus TaxID=1306991 RepID=UPI00141F0349|nr:winged helix-turn-helix transcriptional regulator [Pseudomaricurvus alkylphenolicus]NIB42999.1 winged helix-turn-helix transcriptional regulator [Pseudomaricurvus alkylphenolicus]
MKSNKNRSLDRIDTAILKTLQGDGRISNVELAKRVNLSPSPCLERVKRLESEGFIQGYFAKLDATKLNQAMSAFIQVTLDRTTADVFERFKEGLVTIPQVAECHMVAGGFDYLVKLRFSDMEAYRVVLGQLVELPGVAQTHTYVVIEDVKQDGGLYLR